jgi:predicted RND superfamily exporter protein
MAIAVIGGLIVSTLLSLVFVPAFFILMDDLSRLFGRLFSRFVGPKDEPESEGVERAIPAVPSDATANARSRIAAE